MAHRPGIPERVREFLDALTPAPRGIVVAVSGGADSMALLHALKAVFAGPLVAAHLNHGLRGRESDADAEFVGDLACKLKLPVTVERRDVAALAAGENLEAAARRVRYEWLVSVAASVGADAIATGHTADDQAETVLFRLLRGSGLRGLRGIAHRRRINESVTVIRPLIDVRRTEIESFLSALRQGWRTDASNADPRITRNRLRAELIPKLASEYNPRVVELLVRLSNQARHWRRIAARETRRTLKRVERPKAGLCIVLDRDALRDVPLDDIVDLWAEIWRRERWPAADMGSREFQRIADWCRGESAALELPGEVRISRRERTIVAGPAQKSGVTP